MMASVNNRLDDLELKIGGPIILGYQWEDGNIRGDDGIFYDTPEDFFGKYPDGRVIKLVWKTVIAYNSEGIFYAE